MASSGDRPRVAVVGGGLAGLSAATFLGRAGVRVDLFEAEDGLGGLARSFDLAGATVERYYHFLCLPDRELLDLAGGLGLRPLWRRTRTTFFHEGRLYPFTSPADLLRFEPITPAARVTMGLETLRWQLVRDWRALDRVPACEWLADRLGEACYRVVWEPLLVSKFGERHREVSAAWIWHRVQRVARSRTSPLHPQVMGCFPGGTEPLLRSLEVELLRLGARIELGAPVEEVLASERRARGLRVSGRELAYDAVVMACPLPRAAALLPGGLEAYRAELERVRFLGVVCVALWLERSVTQSFWCNIHDSRLELIGAIEMSELDPTRGRGGALVYVPFYLPVEAPLYAKEDAALVAQVLDELAEVAPGRRRPVARAHAVFRSAYAQPICTVGFGESVPGHRTPLAGLYLVDCTQMYPMDRTLSGTVSIARAAAELVARDMRT